MADAATVEHTHCYCALCISRCGSIARVENDRFIALEPDPSHPTGKALVRQRTSRARTGLSQGPPALSDETDTPENGPGSRLGENQLGRGARPHRG